MQISPVELLIFQPTPFCNLNCSYCYLPDRKDSRILDVETVRVTLEKLKREALLAPEISVIWHAGEPMVVNTTKYSEFFDVIRQTVGDHCKVRHHFQTNAVLIDQKWCDFIRKHEIAIGVSIDGPEGVHDSKRKTWSGRGTWSQVTRGIERLVSNDIPFHTISVVSESSLDCASEIFSFLRAMNPVQIGFNIEECEGANTSSSLDRNSERVDAFFRQVYRLAKSTSFDPPIREFDESYLAIESGVGKEGNTQTRPFRIFSVSVTGEFSTFSPELLGFTSAGYGSLDLGNVRTDSPRKVASSSKFLKIFGDIEAGISKCQQSCEYYDLCGGGAPANKLFETGTFNSAATRFCEFSVKIPRKIVLEDLESVLAQDCRAGSTGPIVPADRIG